jgi:protoheme IX farnesyltransferase
MKTDVAVYDKREEHSAASARVRDFFTLSKARLNALVVLTTAGGYYMAGPEPASLPHLVLTCMATALVAGGSAAINQVTESDTDRLMERTRHRPVADGRISRTEGMLIGLALSGAGVGLLGAGVNLRAALVALATLFCYVFIYTPLKRHTSLATVVGAVPGALPPIIGWAAVRDSIAGPLPWSLFTIMFFWQLPHFLAIAWICRDDYARAGFPMLSVIDKDGGVTGRQAALWSAALVPVAQLPFLLGMTTMTYGIGAGALSVLQLVVAVRFARHRSNANARSLFYASILYLPLLWGLMVVARQG